MARSRPWEPARPRWRGRRGARRRLGSRRAVAGRAVFGAAAPTLDVVKRASSNWSRRPPIPARSGSIAASRRAASARPGTAAPSPDARSATRRPRIASIVWSSSVRASRPCSSSPSSSAMPVAASPATSASMNASTASASASPRRSRTRRSSMSPGGGREQLVEHRLRVAHPAGGEAGDERQGRRLGGPAVGREDARELALDLGDRQASDVVALEARQDRRREPRRLGRGEHEDHELGRLLERLQERVPGVLRDLVRLVEDVDLALELARGIRQALAEVADRVDAAVAGGVDLDEVQRRALADRDAGRAGVAGVAVAQVRAVDRLGEDPRQRGLARAARPDEQDRVRDPTGPHGVPQRLDDRFLADDLPERLRAPAAVEGLVRDG